jgi:hypothetical protein
MLLAKHLDRANPRQRAVQPRGLTRGERIPHFSQPAPPDLTLSRTGSIATIRR